MGWAHCGLDSKGREIGYSIEATCDHPGCDKVINRGLGCVCGDMHGEDEYSCEGYFCGQHKSGAYIDDILEELVEDDTLKKKISDQMKCYYSVFEKGTTCLACSERNEKFLTEEILEMIKEDEKVKG